MNSRYQTRVLDWARRTFGSRTADNPTERIMRFLEEALELVQALGLSEEEVGRVVAYVYGRSVGEPAQEVGGTMVTLASLCEFFGIDMQREGDRELARIDTPEMRAKIAAKQAMKRAAGMTADSRP